jgi:transposase/DNA-binding XRE family transcriptional regulator
VREVLRPKRDGKRRPGEGKDDAGDAERAARDVLAGKVTSIPKQRGGWVEELRALDVARGRCVKARKESLAAARSLVSTAPDRQRRRWEGMSADKMMSAMAAVDGDEASALERSLLSIARVWDAARREADALEGEMRAVLERNCPALLAMFCCGVDDAAALAIAAGENTGRFKDEASFAKHCGVAPIPASSGKTSGRMRLNRGGDRSANSALHLIVTRRIRFDPETQRYVERRCSGKGALSKREAIRCLKRYVAREAFHALTHPFDVPEPERDGQGLKEARRSAGIRQRQVAEAIGVTSACISNIETGKVSNRSRAFRLYAEWVGNGMPLDVGAEESDGEICG